MTSRVVPPDPWATTDPREALRDTNAARIVSLCPGPATMQVGNRSVPYFGNMVDFCGHDENYTPTVRFTGQKALVLRSVTQHVHGGGSGGICEPIGRARQVRAEGSPVTRDGDLFWMDNRHTVGEATFVRDTACYPAPDDRDPIPGSKQAGLSSAVFHPGTSDSDASDGLLQTVAAITPDAGGFRFAPSPGFSPPTTGTPPGSTGTAPTVPGPSGLPGPSPVQRLYWAWQMGGATGDALREAMEGPAGDTAREIAREQELQVPRGTGQAEAIRRADGEREFLGLRGSLPYVGYEGDIRFANKLLSLKAGRPVDFRTMDQDELAELMNRPWPSADEIAENEKKLEEQNVRVSPKDEDRKCPSITLCFKPRPGVTYDAQEYRRQLGEQEAGLNKLTPQEWLTNRSAVVTAQGTDTLRNTPQARAASTRTWGQFNLGGNPYPSGTGLAALHELDIVAGGYADRFARVGPQQENGILGAQWAQGRGYKGGERLRRLNEHAEDLQKNGCPTMNTKLRVCIDPAEEEGDP